jgi:hypothetical protein
MAWFGWGAAYLAGHLALYFIVLRHTRAFSREASIFLYHLASAIGMTLVVLLAVLLAPSSSALDLATAIGIVALHGIYSMSFLELWSLSEGGYSLAIMAHVEGYRTRGLPVRLDGLHRIGRSKQANRIGGIAQLGLVRREREQIVLTPVGRVVAVVLAVIAWAANIRVHG